MADMWFVAAKSSLWRAKHQKGYITVIGFDSVETRALIAQRYLE
jgi:hypothetical protein